MLKKILLVLVVAFVLAQLIRPDRSNPPENPASTMYAKMQVPKNVADIFERSCRDCHSNRTTWPWYAQIAPVSWLLADDVKDGRKELNISDWARYDNRRGARKMKEICEQVERGEMPMKMYIPLHPAAKLSDSDKAILCGWAKSQEARLAAAQ